MLYNLRSGFCVTDSYRNEIGHRSPSEAFRGERKMKFLKVVMLVGAVALFMSPTLKAGTVTIDFGSCGLITPPIVTCPNVDAGTNVLTYANGGVSVTATGLNFTVFPTPNTPEDLYVKQAGSGETGLGTVIDTADHEITNQDYVNLDMSNLAAHGIFSGTLTLESLQAGEAFEICSGSSTSSFGTVCSGPLGTGATNFTANISWTGTSDDILSITGVDNNTVGADVLIGSLTVPTPTPEPATLTLLGLGMFGLAGARRKAAKK